MKPYKKHFPIYIILLIIITLGGCARRKTDKKVSVMKNLTAHYNIYYNAKVDLEESERNILSSHNNNYNQLLEIFPVPTEGASNAEEKNLNEVIERANRIALEKFESNWVDDAFLLLAKSEYYKRNFYNSAEYFSYVATNYSHKKERKNTIEGSIWQGISLFALQEYTAADSVLKVALFKKTKYHKAHLNAAIANSFIHQEKITDAISHLKKAINFTKNRHEKIRWTYILAQLQELIDDNESAYKNYTKVVKSNASFEMSFNANLAQIRLKETANGEKFNKIATLTRLLKEDKNKEFKDQIYYQIAAAYEEQGKLDLATKFYKTSAHEVSGSAQQKGLSYLRLAEINFDSLKNYVQAQLYYDSTLQSLPQTYPNYKSIEIKAKNLQYLAERLILIEKEEKLLSLANLTEDARLEYIDLEVKKLLEQKNAVANTNSNSSQLTDISNNSKQQNATGTFYFNNSAAISQGLNEFKKKWGNRQLEDNWRISAGVNSSNQNAANNSNANNNLPTKTDNIDSLKNSILKTIPLTLEEQLTAKNKIKTAHYEIAIFYKDVLKDNIAAIDVLEKLIPEYNANDQKVAELYYQLYRLYEPVNSSKSELYKKELIKRYPESIFAKSLLNPNFGKEEEAILDNLKKEYALIYENYQQKEYSNVIAKISSLESTLNKYPKEMPQFLYLKSLAIGHTQKTPVFVSSLNEILTSYSEDSTVTSLVKSQLSFIEKNKEIFNRRKTALLNYDTNEHIPALTEQVVFRKVDEEEKVIIAEAPKTTDKVAEVKKPNTEAIETASTKPIEPEKPKTIAFSNNTRIKHVIIIDIKNGSLNVAKPFAALTKYFYSKFDPSLVNLTIRTVGNSNKLIAIRAQFNSKEQAQKTLEELTPSLKEILGLDTKEYGTFVISEPNLLLINNSESLNQYLNYNK